MQHDRPSLVAYLSGHGFGHFTRSAAVLERLAGRYAIHVRTSAQALQLARLARWPASVTEVDVGPGVAQRGPLAVDVEATIAALHQHLERLPGLVTAESDWLRRLAPGAVFADVPPLAFAAAAAAGVPSLGMSNFTWSWIYQGYAHHHDAFAEAAARLRDHEARATRFLALDGGGGLDHLPGRVPIPPVVRRPSPAFEGPAGRARLRRHLGIPDDEPRPVVLVSFGGFGAELALRQAAADNTALRLLLVSGPPDLALPHARSVEPGEGVRPAHLAPAPASEIPLTHPDLVAAADCVIGKPGYGTVAECLHRPTAFAHVPRGEFREYPALVQLIRRWLPERALPLDDFLAGRWAGAVAAALASIPAERPPAGDGVAEAAAELDALAGGAVDCSIG